VIDTAFIALALIEEIAIGGMLLSLVLVHWI
jgi:hypothetical protein